MDFQALTMEETFYFRSGDGGAFSVSLKRQAVFAGPASVCVWGTGGGLGPR